MTIKEFEEYNRTNTMPCDWMGQGSGYKAESWDSDDDIIYIPELAYEDDDDGTTKVDRDDAFSLNDLIIEMGNYFPYDKLDDADKRAAAVALFNYLDWQFPSTALSDGEDDHEYFGINFSKFELLSDRKTLFDIMSNDMEVMSEHGDSEESLLLELAFADDDQIAEYKQTFIVDRAFDVIRESMKGE